MIRYKKTWYGVNIIFRIAGTSWPYGVLPGAFACAASIILSYYEKLDDTISERTEFIDHPYAFQLFAYMLGFLMVFRTNFAYQRYWEAMGMLQAMGAKWIDGACMGITFDAGGDSDSRLLAGMFSERSMADHPTTGSKGGPHHSLFAQDMCHLCSLLHALALMSCRGDTDLNNIGTARDSSGNFISVRTTISSAQPTTSKKRLAAMAGISHFGANHVKEVFSQQRLRVLGGLNQNERQALEKDCNGRPFSSEARVAMVQSWFMRRLIARQKFEQGESSATSPPILSRLYQVISDGGLWFSHASKIAITPFPLPYHNLIGILLWSYTFLVPFLINGLIMDKGARAGMAFMAVFVYHALAQVGDNLEDPYTPYDPNELPLPEIQDSVNTRLLMFGIVPEESDEWEHKSCQNGNGTVSTTEKHSADPTASTGSSSLVGASTATAVTPEVPADTKDSGGTIKSCDI